MTRSDESTRHQRVFELFRACADLPADERTGFLGSSCDEPELRAEVEALLELDSAAAPPLDGERVRLEVSDAPQPVPRELPSVPESIGGYRVIRMIGRGAMGAVYEAEQDTPRRRVALKVLLDTAMRPDLVRRFEFESEVLARLDHPAIARVIEAGTFEQGGAPRPFFAMEYVEGAPLTTWATAADLSPRARVALVARVADAIHYAHLRGVVHRDLKPANVLVNSAGEPKVLDFGVARALEHEERDPRERTAHGQLVGTLAYMSPEQAQGRSDRVDARSDVWSLGVLLYELLAGRLPLDVDGLPLHRAVLVIAEGRAAPLEGADRRLAGDLATIAHTALAVDPERRYGSAGELAADLRRFLALEPIAARPATRTYRLLRFTQRHRALVASLAATIIGLTVSLVVSLVALDRVRAAEGKERSERKRAQTEADTRAAIDRFILKDMIAAASPFRAGHEVKVVDVLEAALPRIQSAFADQPGVRAGVLTTLGVSLHELGLWARADEVLARAVAESSAAFGPGSPEHLEARYELARSLGSHSDPRAITILEELQRETRRTLGPRHELTLRIEGDLALCMTRHQDAEAGVALARRVLDDSRAEFGANHPRALAAQRKLAEGLDEAGQWREAEGILRDYLARLRERHAGPHHDAINAAIQLGRVLLQLAQDEEAETLLREAIDAAHALLGPDSAETIVWRFALVEYYSTTRRWEDAEREVRAVLARADVVLGRHHRYTLVGHNNHAVFLRRLKRFDEALALAEEVLAAREAQAPRDVKMLAESHDVIAAIHLDEGRLAEADRHLSLALELGEEGFGAEHPRVADMLFNLGDLLMRRDEHARAEATYARLIELDSGLRGPEHPFVAAELHQLGRTLAAQAKHAEAVATFERCIALREKIGQTDAPWIHSTRVELGVSLEALGRAAEGLASARAGLVGLEALGADERIEQWKVREKVARLEGAAAEAAR